MNVKKVLNFASWGLFAVGVFFYNFVNAYGFYSRHWHGTAGNSPAKYFISVLQTRQQGRCRQYPVAMDRYGHVLRESQGVAKGVMDAYLGS